MTKREGWLRQGYEQSYEGVAEKKEEKKSQKREGDEEVFTAVVAGGRSRRFLLFRKE